MIDELSDHLTKQGGFFVVNNILGDSHELVKRKSRIKMVSIFMCS